MEEELRNSEEADRRKKEEERQRSLAALAASDQASVSADPPAKTLELPSPADSAEPALNPSESPDPAAGNDSAPRIMPPSTGETVAAARPNRGLEPPPEPPSETDSSPSIPPPPDTSPDDAQTLLNQSADPAEALNQHG
jgi:hypothetical protein